MIPDVRVPSPAGNRQGLCFISWIFYIGGNAGESRPGRVLFYIIALPLHATHSTRGIEHEY